MFSHSVLHSYMEQRSMIYLIKHGHKSRQSQIILFLMMILLCFNFSFSQQARTINGTGGVEVDYSDGIALFVGDRGDIQMVANSVGHLYSSNYRPPNMGSNTIALRLQTGAANPRIYSRNNGNIIALSQSVVTGSGTTLDPWQVVTRFRPSGVADSAITIELTDSYVFPSFRFTRRINVTGISPTDVAKVYWYFDSMVGGNDYGNGFISAGIVGTRHPTTLERLEFQHQTGPMWDRYYTGRYNSPPTLISSNNGDLNNLVDTNNVDAGMALQWNVPLGQSSVTVESDLAYYPAGIFAREIFTPSTIMLNDVSRMKITLSHIGLVDSPASFVYTLPVGDVAVAAIPNLSNTCAPGGGSINAVGNTITVTNLILQAMPSTGPAYVCDIEFDVKGIGIGPHRPNFTSGNQTVGHSASQYAILDVQPIVSINAYFAPRLISVGNISLLTIDVFNRDLAAQTGQQFKLEASSTDLVPVSPVRLTSTCSSTPIVSFSGPEIDFSQLNLAAASSASSPSQCTITIAMTSATVNPYLTMYYNGSSTGVGYIGNQPELHVTAAIQASAYFDAPIVGQGTVSTLTITLVNASALATANGYFIYDLSPDIPIASPNNLSSTCSTGATISVVGSKIEVTNLSLAGNVNQPAVCTISLDVTTPMSGSHYISFSSPDTTVVAEPPYTFLQVTDAADPESFSAAVRVSNPTISIDQPATVTISFIPNATVPLTDIDFLFYFDGAQLLSPISESVGCSGIHSNIESNYINFTHLTLDNNIPCIISFELSSSAAGIYSLNLYPVNGFWLNLVNGNSALIVLGGFVRAASDTIPVFSLAGLGILIGGLWLISRRRFLRIWS